MGVEQFLWMSSLFILLGAFVGLFVLSFLTSTWKRASLRWFSLFLFLFVLFILKDVLNWSSFYYWIIFSSMSSLPSFLVTFLYSTREAKEILLDKEKWKIKSNSIRSDGTIILYREKEDGTGEEVLLLDKRYKRIRMKEK